MELTKIPQCLAWVFFIGGIYFLAKDISLFVLWLLFVPTGYLFWKAIERQKVMLTIVMAFFLVTLGVDPVFFYLRREKYTMTGWYAVGMFSFEPLDFVKVYLPVVIMALSIFVFFNLLMPKESKLIEDYLKFFERKQKTWQMRRQSRAFGMALCVLLVAVFIPLNIWMFEKGVGITGMVSPVLPFRLVGILHYFRLLIIPMLIFLLYINAENTNLQFACVLLYAFVSAFASASRSLFMINMIICILVNVLNKNWKNIAISIAFIAVMFALIGTSRNYIYVYNYDGYFNLVEKVLKNFSLSQIESTVTTTIAGISNRLFGMQYYVLAEQNGVEGGLLSLIKYFKAGTFQAIVPDMSTSIFGLELLEGYAFGVAMGVVSELLMLANGNYLMIVFEGFLIALLLVVMEKMILYVHEKNKLISAFLCLIFAYVLLQFWFANLKMAYMCMIMSCLLVMGVYVLEKMQIYIGRCKWIERR